MKRTYLLMAMLLVMAMTGCGKETSTIETTTQEQITESTINEQTEVTTQEQTEMTTETITEEEAVLSGGEVSTEIAPEDQTGGTMTPNQALELIEKTLGTEDAETGDAYSYSHVNTMTVNGVEYHVFMWGETVDGEFSKIGDLFVATDGSAIYEGIFVGDGATINTDTNYLK